MRPFGGQVSRDGMVEHTRSRPVEHRGGERGDEIRTAEFGWPIGLACPLAV